MAVGANLYLWSHPLFAQAVETKMSSKICAHAMETPTFYHNYRMYHKNWILMHALVRVHVVHWLGGFVWYLYEICTLFPRTIYVICAKMQNRNLWRASHGGGVGCRTGGLTKARGEGLTWCLVLGCGLGYG
jgi:hypothetical protein